MTLGRYDVHFLLGVCLLALVAFAFVAPHISTLLPSRYYMLSAASQSRIDVGTATEAYSGYYTRDVAIKDSLDLLGRALGNDAAMGKIEDIVKQSEALRKLKL